jgi:hypothetical protein
MPTITKAKAIKMGIPKKNLQTILIPDTHTLEHMQKWLKDNNYVNSNYRKTKNFIRFLQNFPIQGATYYTKKLSNGVELVFQQY